MSRYWVAAPYDSTSPQVFDKAWEYDLKNGTIAIGWRELGDISQCTKAEIGEKYNASLPNATRSVATRDTNALWAFYHEISPGDIIIARRGVKKIVGIGTVAGVPFYHEQEGRNRVANLTDNAYSNFLPVKWQEKFIPFDDIVFSMYTLYEIGEERYRELVSGANLPPTEDGGLGLTIDSAWERDLENLIVANFERIFKGQLALFKDSEGNPGKQYPVFGEKGKLIGRIDILAVEPKSNSFVVIELKKGAESDQVVGQILRYMGWVKQNLCLKGEGVRGLIICKEADEKLTYALRIVHDKIRVKFYQLDITLIDP